MENVFKQQVCFMCQVQPFLPGGLKLYMVINYALFVKARVSNSHKHGKHT